MVRDQRMATERAIVVHGRRDGCKEPPSVGELTDAERESEQTRRSGSAIHKFGDPECEVQSGRFFRLVPGADVPADGIPDHSPGGGGG